MMTMTIMYANLPGATKLKYVKSEHLSKSVRKHTWTGISLTMLLTLTTEYNDIKVSIMQLNAPVGDSSMKTSF